MEDHEDSPAGFVDRWTAALRALEAQLLATSSSPTLPALSSSLKQLSAELTEWAERLPAYDLRRCERDLKGLSDTLSAAKATAAPKAKFSFKKKASSTAAPTARTPLLDPQPSPAAAASTERLPPPTPANALNLSDYSDRYLSLGDLPNSSSNSEALVVSALRGCFVDLTSDGTVAGETQRISTIYLYSLKNCIVVLEPVLGSIMVHGCEGCTFFLGAHQFRIHASSGCFIFLQIGSNPIIESSHSLTFSPYPAFLSPTPLPPSSFASVQDFDQPFANASRPSSNWRIASEEDSSCGELFQDRGRRKEEWRELLAARLQIIASESPARPGVR